MKTRIRVRAVKQKPTTPLPKLCTELQNLQRQREVTIKSRNMAANRLQAVIAGTLGYYSGMAEAQRKEKFTEAKQLIDQVDEGAAIDHPFVPIIKTTLIGIRAFNEMIDALSKEQVSLVKQLPPRILDWVQNPKQLGLGLPILACILGETGDLSNYPNPGKVWKRMGCAPYTFDNRTRMGSTWRFGKEGKLPASEWESFGYSPRRRSIAYRLGECLLRQNGPRKDDDGEIVKEAGPYYLRYLESRKKLKEDHPDYPDGRCHRHGMLLSTKLCLRELWNTWQAAVKWEAEGK